MREIKVQSFTDNTGYCWTLAVTVAAIARAQAIAGVDLYHLVKVNPDGSVDDTALQAWAGDPVAIANTAYAICYEQTQQAGLKTAAEFMERLDAAALDSAGLAILNGVVDFFPLSVRLPLKKILQNLPAARAETEEQIKRILSEDRAMTPQ